ncbi:MAG: hypothetical protein AB1633_05640 [Elusimicrobiota bacterium]
MEFKELETTIKKAASIIQEYNETTHFIEKTYRKNEIENLKTIILKEAYALGASGNTCPRCNGSGRI